MEVSLQSRPVNDTQDTPPQAPEPARAPRIRPQSLADVAYPKTIKSFVRRAGRVTSGQTKAFDELGPRFLLPYQAKALDFATAFAEAANPADAADSAPRPTVLELGFGMGEATAHIAAALPQTNFLCCEVHEPGVGALLKRIGGGRVAALVIMIFSPAIRKLIREDKVAQMYSAIQTGQNHGMQTLDQALESLVSRGIVNKLEAARRAVDKRMFQ